MVCRDSNLGSQYGSYIPTLQWTTIVGMMYAPHVRNKMLSYLPLDHETNVIVIVLVDTINPRYNPGQGFESTSIMHIVLIPSLQCD